MRPVGIFLFLSLLLCSSIETAAEREPSRVTLSLDEFEELFSSARLEEAQRQLLDQRKMNEAEHVRKLSELEKKSMQLDIEAMQRRAELFPENFQVLRHTASGYFNASDASAGVEHDVASFDLELTLRVMEPKWTTVPIANANSTVASDWNIAWSPDNEDFRPVDPVTSPEVMLLQKGMQQVLATNRSGLFKVQFKKHAKVGKTSRNLNSVGISSLLYPLSDFSLRVTATGESSSVRDVSVQPANAVIAVHPSSTGCVDIQVTLPLTADSIDLRWLELEETTQEDELKMDESSQKEGPPQVTAVHEVLHSVGEGIVRSSHIVDFSTPSEMSTPSSLTFEVQGENVRITAIEGHALQHWEHVTDNDTAALVVRAVFKSSHLDSTATLLVRTESDWPTGSSTASQVMLPSIKCRNVLRQINVEVHQHDISGLSPCEPTEFSSQLRLNIDRPIVLSYKYLSPQNSVTLTVLEHQTIETLEATIDRVHYKAVVTETHTMHSLILTMQSTKLQYLELLDLPSTASMFTLIVNSVPAKPVYRESDDSSSILIPLLIGLDPEVANKGSSMRTSVEVTFVSTHEKSLGKNGTLSLDPPRFGLPVSVETIHLRLPNSYEYDFAGDFGAPKEKLAYPIPSAFTYKTGRRIVEKDYEFSAIDDIWAEEDKEDTVSAVKIATPNTGRSFYFQKLFVVDAKLSLSAEYKEPIEKREFWLSRYFSVLRLLNRSSGYE